MKTLFVPLLLLFNFFIQAQPALFESAGQPTAPDYSKDKSWAALPFRQDAADVIPSFETWVNDSLKEADVFFIYPTIYITGNSWTADVNDKKLNKKIDKKPIRYQASVFNQSCRVFAPRYRQARLNAFSDKENGLQALEFAYQDVKKAFEYYLQHYNHGRPIIIASHSQGTYHARRLLLDFFDDAVLRDKLVCAYMVGFGVDGKKYLNLKPCNNATETGCYVTWASFKKGFEPGESPLYGNVCVNPISWSTDTVNVDASKSVGALLLSFGKKYEHVCSAEIHSNFIWVQADLPVVRSINNLHVADYNLYWFDIRKNVQDRIAAFLKK